jgi:hypothetical protein
MTDAVTGLIAAYPMLTVFISASAVVGLAAFLYRRLNRGSR